MFMLIQKFNKMIIFFGVSIPVLNLCTDLHIMPNDVGYGMMEILISLNF